MSLAYWCVAFAAVMPYLVVALTLVPSQRVPSRWGKGYDNRDPREESRKLVGWRRRAHHAHANAFEAFPPFAAAVLMATTLRGGSPAIDAWASAFVGLRVAFSLLYVADRATARSAVWSLAALCVLALFAIAAGL